MFLAVAHGSTTMYRFTSQWRQTSKTASRRRLRLEELESRLVPSLLGQQLFPSDYPWNQRITSAPVAANSASIMNNLLTIYGDGRLHPDFGQDSHTAGAPLYGIPYNIVHGNTQAKIHVVIDAFASESDLQDAPVPASAVLEGDLQSGPTVGLANRGDSHLLVWDEDNNIAYEFYHASRPSENSDGSWHADQETVWNMKTEEFRTLGFTSADAAGLSILAGLARPDEGLPTSEGGQGAINHAIRFTLQNAIVLDQFLYPASHTANPGNTNRSVMPPMGARFRLKASVDISTLNPESRVIAQAMKDYGLMLADNGSNFFFTGASYSVDASNQFTLTWNDNDIQDTLHGLKSLHYSNFEVVDLTPVVTGLSVHNGTAGSTITIIGQNFSGAAGLLQVTFGNAPATNVTFVDDAHITVTVPAGSGAVDVRVQSGVTTSPDSSNYNDPIFGYGLSAVTANDQFTYGVGGDAPPTVAQAAAASPNPATGTTSSLSVLGADDDGEASLTYSWTATTSPSGSHPTFSSNGTNAAKNSTVTFDRAGAYVFQATITDPSGLTVTSSVSVTVKQTVTSITISPPSVTLRVGGTQQFVASVFDQFGQTISGQTITWSLVSGIGSINTSGLYHAPKKGTGSAVIQAAVGKLTARANITITATGVASPVLTNNVWWRRRLLDKEFAWEDDLLALDQ
jgi:hypothetical protein